jgi:hypothetical protein
MRKVRLDVETLQIESFVTETSSARRGTVKGQSYYEPSHYTVCPFLCDGGGGSGSTCYKSCDPAFCGDDEM